MLSSSSIFPHSYYYSMGSSNSSSIHPLTTSVGWIRYDDEFIRAIRYAEALQLTIWNMDINFIITHRNSPSVKPPSGIIRLVLLHQLTTGGKTKPEMQNYLLTAKESVKRLTAVADATDVELTVVPSQTSSRSSSPLLLKRMELLSALTAISNQLDVL